jgi:hypothetical protein
MSMSPSEQEELLPKSLCLSSARHGWRIHILFPDLFNKTFFQDDNIMIDHAFAFKKQRISVFCFDFRENG